MTEYAWHFLSGSDRPLLRDGTPLEIGRWYEHTGPLVMCSSGYHASTRAIDALQYAPGPWVSLCEIDGEIARQEEDKLVCTRRRALWCYDATEVLRQFARECALGVLHLWNPPPPDIVAQFLESGDESLRAASLAAARAAAWDAAWAAAWDAARAAAWDAARAAALDAARDAAWDAARAAPWAAAWDAARAAAWDDQNHMLEGMLMAEAPGDLGLEMAP